MNRAYLGVLSASLLIVACDGGGSSFGGEEPVSSSFPITGSNGAAAVGISYEAALASGDLISLGGAFGLSANAPDGFAIAERAREAENLVMKVISQIPLDPIVQDCGLDPSFGTFTISGELVDPLAFAVGILTVGDTFRVVYDMCDEGFGEVIDGTIDLEVTDFSGDVTLGLYRLAMDAVVGNLQVTTGADTFTGDGDVAITLDTEDAPFISAGTSGSSMLQGTNTSSETLTNFSSSQTYDGNQNPAEYTLGASGRLDSSQLPGVVDYSTTTEFVGFDGSYPHTGVFEVVGDNSKATLIVESDTNVRIEIDNNGDGVTDETLNLTWDDLTT